jgi:hypothetical protein
MARLQAPACLAWRVADEGAMPEVEVRGVQVGGGRRWVGAADAMAGREAVVRCVVGMGAELFREWAGMFGV